MKRKWVLLLAVVLVVAAAAPAGAAWLERHRVTRSPGDSTEPAVAVAGQDVHVAWEDDRTGDWEIYYRSSTDGGVSWNPISRITKKAGNSIHPELATTGARLYLVWLDEQFNSREVVLLRGNLNEGTWEGRTRLTRTPHQEWSADVAAFGDAVHVVWQEELPSGLIRLVYARSTNGGAGWHRYQVLERADRNAVSPAVAVDGNTVHVVWVRWNGPDADVVYRRSLDGGATWEPRQAIANIAGQAEFPDIAADSGRVHIAWTEDPQGDLEAFYRGSGDGGATWGARKRVVRSVGRTGPVAIAADGTEVWVIAEDTGSHGDIRATTSIDGGASWSRTVRLEGRGGVGQRPNADADCGRVEVVWQQWKDSVADVWHRPGT